MKAAIGGSSWDLVKHHAAQPGARNHLLLASPGGQLPLYQSFLRRLALLDCSLRPMNKGKTQMKNVVLLSVLTIALCAPCLAAPPGVQPVPGSRTDYALTAGMQSGETYLAGRDLKVDLNFLSGKSAKGKLFILFEPASRLSFWTYGWEERGYPAVGWMDHIKTYSRVGVAADRLFIVSFAQGIVIAESSEKANSIDDAETQSLKWVGDHLAEIEARSPVTIKVTSLAMDHSFFPEGFFRSPWEPAGMRVNLIDMEWQRGEWALTLQHMDTKKTTIVWIGRANGWNLRLSRPRP